jgi:sulfite exporter TauE/SafE
VIGLGFGFQLGLAVATIVTTATVYVALAAALLGGSVAVGATIGVVFGLARALPILAARRVSDPARLRRQHQRLARWQPRAHTAALAAQAAAAALALAAVVVLPLVNSGGAS